MEPIFLAVSVMAVVFSMYQEHAIHQQVQSQEALLLLADNSLQHLQAPLTTQHQEEPLKTSMAVSELGWELNQISFLK